MTAKKDPTPIDTPVVEENIDTPPMTRIAKMKSYAKEPMIIIPAILATAAVIVFAKNAGKPMDEMTNEDV